jgi:hypothetical protein
LWAKSYEGNLQDTLAVQKSVAEDIAQQIRIEFTPEERGPEKWKRGKRMSAARVPACGSWQVLLQRLASAEAAKTV